MSCANRDGTKPTWENSRKQRKILAELTDLISKMQRTEAHDFRR